MKRPFSTGISVRSASRPADVFSRGPVSNEALSADAAGADGVVIPERRAVDVTATVVKSSAGASEHLPKEWPVHAHYTEIATEG